MSRFFARDSDSESESSSSEEEIAPHAGQQGRAFAWSSDDEDTKRIVRSEKDKRYEELRDIIKKLRNHKKIKDMSKSLSDFEDLCRAYDKSKKVVAAEGIPKFYVSILVELEDFINETWEDRDGRKAMSKSNAKGLTTLRQKHKRYIKDFETEMANFREKPEEEEEQEKESQEESEDDDVDFGSAKKVSSTELKPSVATLKFQKGAVDDDEDSDSSWPSDSETSSSEDEEKYTGQLTADFFLKKKGDDDEELEQRRREKEKERERRRERDRLRKAEDAAKDAADGWTTVTGGIAAPSQVKAKLFPDDAEITVELVTKKLVELLAGRGKKGTDRTEQVDMLVELKKISVTNKLGPAMECKVLFSIVSAIFDSNPSVASCMKADSWNRTLTSIQELLDLLKEQRGKILVGMNIADESEVIEGDGPWRVRGCILSLIERMDEEFTKMLQSCDAHSTDYVDRLRDEKVVCDLILQLEVYLHNNSTSDEMCRVYLKHIEHIYYKFERLNRKQSQDEEGQEQQQEAEEESRITMDRLCKYIYEKDITDRIRTRAILCHIYHHALHDRWFAARDLMLMSHLQDTIQHSDIPIQIMYNRSMVQLGLCAFRQNMIKDAHNCLVDIQSSGRAKELLAQGLLLQRQYERTAEQEKMEKRRQMPYHMHINLEMLECVYLISAMLIEIPYMAAHEFDARRRMISKNFHHVMRVSERQTVVGPPESMREHVVAASKAMKSGNWEACRDFIINDKMNAKVWDLFYEQKRIKEMLVANIKEESLRTYLFTYSKEYDSISMEALGNMFELPKSSVHSIISKMIINEELMASLDEPSQCVVMHRTEPTRLQSLALQLSEKVASLVDFNERHLEAKQGGGFFNYQRGGQDQQGYRRDNRNEGGYGDKKGYGGGRGGGGYDRGSGRGGNRGGRYGESGGRGGRRNQEDYNNTRNTRYGYE